jgi:uncharacterized protein with HEPN domain
MSPLDRRRKHLHDLDRVLTEIEAFTAGRRLDDLLGDRSLQLILEREFEILGEALNRLLRDEPEIEPLITHARRIVGLRNLLAHGYDVVDHRVLWSVVEFHLPLLKIEVAQLLSSG